MKVIVRVDSPGVEAATKEVALPEIAPIEPLRVGTQESLHSVPEICVRRSDDQMRVRIHQAVRKTGPLAANDDPLEPNQEVSAILIVVRDRSACIALGNDVVVRAGCLVSGWSGHSHRVAATSPFG